MNTCKKLMKASFYIYRRSSNENYTVLQLSKLSREKVVARFVRTIWLYSATAFLCLQRSYVIGAISIIYVESSHIRFDWSLSRISRSLPKKVNYEIRQ